MKQRIAVLVSGGGTNLQALLDREKDGAIPSGEIVLVLSNREGAYALTRAANAGKAAFTVTRKKAGSQEAFEKEITRILEDHQVDLIILAGFLAILSQDFTDRWAGRIINIHPSLIPSFCGAGFYGLHVHEAALARGVKVSGATVHYVNEIPDGGEIILQKAFPGTPLKPFRNASWRKRNGFCFPRQPSSSAADFRKTEEKNDAGIRS